MNPKSTKTTSETKSATTDIMRSLQTDESKTRSATPADVKSAISKFNVELQKIESEINKLSQLKTSADKLFVANSPVDTVYTEIRNLKKRIDNAFREYEKVKDCDDHDIDLEWFFLKMEFNSTEELRMHKEMLKSYQDKPITSAVYINVLTIQKKALENLVTRIFQKYLDDIFSLQKPILSFVVKRLDWNEPDDQKKLQDELFKQLTKQYEEEEGVNYKSLVLKFLKGFLEYQAAYDDKTEQFTQLLNAFKTYLIQGDLKSLSSLLKQLNVVAEQQQSQTGDQADELSRITMELYTNIVKNISASLNSMMSKIKDLTENDFARLIANSKVLNEAKLTVIPGINISDEQIQNAEHLYSLKVFLNSLRAGDEAKIEIPEAKDKVTVLFLAELLRNPEYKIPLSTIMDSQYFNDFIEKIFQADQKIAQDSNELIAKYTAYKAAQGTSPIPIQQPITTDDTKKSRKSRSPLLKISTADEDAQNKAAIQDLKHTVLRDRAAVVARILGGMIIQEMDILIKAANELSSDQKLFAEIQTQAKIFVEAYISLQKKYPTIADNLEANHANFENKLNQVVNLYLVDVIGIFKQLFPQAKSLETGKKIKFEVFNFALDILKHGKDDSQIILHNPLQMQRFLSAYIECLLENNRVNVVNDLLQVSSNLPGVSPKECYIKIGNDTFKIDNMAQVLFDFFKKNHANEGVTNFYKTLLSTYPAVKDGEILRAQVKELFAQYFLAEKIKGYCDVHDGNIELTRRYFTGELKKYEGVLESFTLNAEAENRVNQVITSLIIDYVKSIFSAGNMALSFAAFDKLYSIGNEVKEDPEQVKRWQVLENIKFVESEYSGFVNAIGVEFTDRFAGLPQKIFAAIYDAGNDNMAIADNRDLQKLLHEFDFLNTSFPKQFYAAQDGNNKTYDGLLTEILNRLAAKIARNPIDVNSSLEADLSLVVGSVIKASAIQELFKQYDLMHFYDDISKKHNLSKTVVAVFDTVNNLYSQMKQELQSLLQRMTSVSIASSRVGYMPENVIAQTAESILRSLTQELPFGIRTIENLEQFYKFLTTKLDAQPQKMVAEILQKALVPLDYTVLNEARNKYSELVSMNFKLAAEDAADENIKELKGHLEQVLNNLPKATLKDEDRKCLFKFASALSIEIPQIPETYSKYAGLYNIFHRYVVLLPQVSEKGGSLSAEGEAIVNEISDKLAIVITNVSKVLQVQTAFPVSIVSDVFKAIMVNFKNHLNGYYKSSLIRHTENEKLADKIFKSDQLKNFSILSPNVATDYMNTIDRAINFINAELAADKLKKEGKESLVAIRDEAIKMLMELKSKYQGSYSQVFKVKSSEAATLEKIASKGEETKESKLAAVEQKFDEQKKESPADMQIKAIDEAINKLNTKMSRMIIKEGGALYDSLNDTREKLLQLKSILTEKNEWYQLDGYLDLLQRQKETEKGKISQTIILELISQLDTLKIRQYPLKFEKQLPQEILDKGFESLLEHTTIKV